MEIGKIGGNVTNEYSTSVNKAADDSFEKKLQSAMDKKDEKELKKVCKEFEGIMLNMMFKGMKATVPKTELLPEDSGREIFESMLDDKLMEEASKSKGLGLADMLYKQLDKRLKNTYKPTSGGDAASIDKE